MKQFKTIYPYNTDSDIFKRYTVQKQEYIAVDNAEIKRIADLLWGKSENNVLKYAELCYHYVAENFKYLYPNTGLHTISTILSQGGGDCGNLSSIFVSLLRTKHIPAKHIVTVRPDGSSHVWADFYLEKYGWIPVDVTMKLINPSGNYFGFCKGDGIVMSDDICFEIENEPQHKLQTTLLQNYLFWYWCKGGKEVKSEYHVKSNLIYKQKKPIISDIQKNHALLKWNSVKGATSYKIYLESKESSSQKNFFEMNTTQTSLSLDHLLPGVEYKMRFIPIRKIENIETMMNENIIYFTTSTI